MAISDESILGRFRAIEQHLNLLSRGLAAKISARALTQIRLVFEDQIAQQDAEIEALKARLETVEKRLNLD